MRKNRELSADPAASGVGGDNPDSDSRIEPQENASILKSQHEQFATDTRQAIAEFGVIQWLLAQSTRTTSN